MPQHTELVLNSIFQGAQTLICRLETDGTIAFINQSYASVFGAAAGDLQGRSLWEFVSAAERARIEHAFALLTPDAPSHSAESSAAGARDATCFHWTSTGLAFDAEGRCRLAQLTGLDITLRKREQEALRLNTERVDEVIEGAGLGTWEWNVETGELRINDRWAEMLGYTIDELSPLSIETCSGLRHPDDLAEANRRAERHLNGDAPYFEVEARMRHKDGSWVWVRDRGRAVYRDLSGRPKLMIGTHLDITRSKNSAQRLLDLTDRLEDAVGAAGLRLWEVDLETGVLSWFPDPESGSGQSETRRPMPALEALGAVHADDRVAFETDARQAIERGIPMCSRVRVVNDAGEVRHVEYRAHLSKDSRLLLGVARDITADIEANEELVVKRREAEAASIVKGEFVAKMSHEIRTPMNGVIGMLEVMRRMDLVPEVIEHVETALSSAQDLMHVLDDVIDSSQLEAKKASINPEAFDIRALINTAIALFDARARQKNIVLSAVIDPDVPTWLLGDRRRIRQVLNNLVGNAIKFTDTGAIDVSTSYEASQGRLRIVVSDTGIGIHEDVAARIFEPFFQADATVTRRFGGSGLGLAICKQLVELMGGEIDISSAPGRGSKFSVTLRLAATDEPVRSTVAPAVPVATAALRILVVEDNLANQKILRTILADVGHTVTIADNGTEAVALAASEHFDLILMDIMMPGMDGVTATRHIRELGGRAGGIPIVALTANALAQDRRRYLAAGMTDYLAKPIDVRALLEVIARTEAVRV